jgi:hypothetical protein
MFSYRFRNEGIIIVIIIIIMYYFVIWRVKNKKYFPKETKIASLVTWQLVNSVTSQGDDVAIPPADASANRTLVGNPLILLK